MTTFKDLWEEDIYEIVGLNRVKSHMSDGRSFGMMSASRGDKSPAENNARHAELKAMVKKAGYSYTKVHGEYPEAGGGMAKEKSLMIFGKKPGEDSGLHGFLMKAGAHFNQDSVIHKAHDADEPHLHYSSAVDGNKVGDNFPLGKFRPQLMNDFGHSALKRGGPGKPGKTPPSAKGFVFSNEPTDKTKSELPVRSSPNITPADAKNPTFKGSKK